MSDLIDALNDAALYFDRKANSCRGTVQGDCLAAGYEERAATQRKAIAFLSSPLPDEIQQLLDATVVSQRTMAEDIIISTMARMLERLAREVKKLKRRPSVATHNALQEECDGRMGAIKKLQAKVEKLTRENASLKLQLKVGPESYEKQIEELEAASQHWKNQWDAACNDIATLKEDMAAKEKRIEELQKAEAKIDELLAHRGVGSKTIRDSIVSKIAKIKELKSQNESLCNLVITMNDRENVLQNKVEKLEADSLDSKREADSLAIALWKKHYQKESPKFELCDSIAGVITQINTMVAGLSEKIVELESPTVSVRGESLDLSEFDVRDKTDD